MTKKKMKIDQILDTGNDNSKTRSDIIDEEMTLHISCKNIKLCDTKADLTIDVPQEKIEQYDAIVINGVKFKKEILKWVKQFY